MIARSRSSDTCQWRASSVPSSTASASRCASTSSINRASSVRARDPAPAAMLRRCCPPRLRTSSARANSRSSGSIGARDRRTILDRVEHSADALVELGVADRHQPRQQQAAPAGANESLGDRADRAVVGEQDASPSKLERIPSERAGSARWRAHPRRNGDRGWYRRWGARQPRQAFSSAASVIPIDLGVPTSNHRPVMDRAEAAAFLDRPVPQDVGRERSLGRVAKQAASTASGCR